jgi:hypothetical protein
MHIVPLALLASMAKFTAALLSPFIQRTSLFRVEFTCRYPFLWRRNSFPNYTYHKHHLHSAIMLIKHKHLFHAQDKLYKEISRCCRPFPTCVCRVKYSILRVHGPTRKKNSCLRLTYLTRFSPTCV